jgi:membrane protease YdiL (CAAX protease family)
MHGSLYMLFYTTALGFALAYIRYATDSLFVVTILHAFVNSISAGVLLLSSLQEITDRENKIINTVYNLYILGVLILVLVGVIVFIVKIPTIKKYKIDNAWREVGAGKKTALFFLSAPVLAMLVLAFNEHSNNRLLSLFLK